MKVRATQMGYYGLIRRNEGEVFEMAESAMKKDKAGKTVLPKWVERADGARETAPQGTGKQEVVKSAAPAPAPAAPKAAEPSTGGEEVI